MLARAADKSGRHTYILRPFELRGREGAAISRADVYAACITMNFDPFLHLFFLSGHGQHLTGLGHVKDLARAMANVLGKECAKGQVYNVQVRVLVLRAT